MIIFGPAGMSADFDAAAAAVPGHRNKNGIGEQRRTSVLTTQLLTSDRLRVRWMELLGQSRQPQDNYGDNPVIAELCIAYVQGADVSAAAEALGCSRSGRFTEDELVHEISMFLLACVQLRCPVQQPRDMVACCVAAYRREAEALSLSGLIKDPLTGVDSFEHALGRLWEFVSCAVRPELLVFDPGLPKGPLMRLGLFVTLGNLLGQCPNLLTAAVTPAGVGISCVANGTIAAATIRAMATIAPSVLVTSHPFPDSGTTVIGFGRWLIDATQGETL